MMMMRFNIYILMIVPPQLHIHTPVHIVYRVNLEPAHPRLSYYIFRFMPEENPRSIAYDLLFRFLINTIALTLVHRMLPFLDQAVDIPIYISSAVARRSEICRIEQREQKVFSIRIIGPPA